MEQSNIKILSVKLVKKGEQGVVIGLKESAMVKSDDEKTIHEAVHPDMYDQLQKLRPHLALRTGLIDRKQIGDQSEMDKYEITGYSIGGKDGQEGITITGMRKNEDGQFYSLNSPFTRISSEEGNGYVLIGQLLSDIEGVEKETGLLLFEGKKKQPSLFNGEEQDDKKGKGKVTKIKVANPETQEEKDEKVLSHLRNGAGHANPDAMKRVAEMDNEQTPDEVINGAIGELVEEQRQTLGGKGKGKSK